MIEIKICGITRLEDALAACDAGADALGFIFYSPSPRYVHPEQARTIIQSLPSAVCKVGVFVNLPPEEILQISSFCGIDLIQLHGDEDPEYCRKLPGHRLIKALSSPGSLHAASSYPVKAILIDSRGPSLYGGTGITADWDLAARVKASAPDISLILAGGLNPGNAPDAISAVRPDALDFNSGIESAPGRKDPAKLKMAMECVQPVFRKIHFRKIFTIESCPG